jgi:hypothetical protein
MGYAAAAVELPESLIGPTHAAYLLPKRQIGSELIDRTKQILSYAGLNINQVSQASSRPPYCELSHAYFVPHTFYSDLRRGEMPHICQVVALSEITNYDFADWLSVFGYSPRVIPRVQMRVHVNNSILLSDAFGSAPAPSSIPIVSIDHTTPLLHLAASLEDKPAGAPGSSDRRPFLYLKVGRDDSMSRSMLVPGSIVCIDPTKTRIADHRNGEVERIIYAVEYSGGFTCCQARRIDRDRALFLPLDLSEGAPEKVHVSDALILGTVESEIRPLFDSKVSKNSDGSLLVRRSTLRGRLSAHMSLAQLLRSSRERLGLRLRDAQAMTRDIAEILDDPSYAISLGALSDYEASDGVARQIAKIISLCIIYAIDLSRFLRVARVRVPSGHQQRIPGLSQPSEDSFFPISELGVLFHGLKLSSQDVYCFGRKDPVLHPAFSGARILVLDRKRRPCSREGGSLILPRHEGCTMATALHFQESDVAIMGRITLVVRSLG